MHHSTDYEVIVVGAGQAGLALGYFLSDQNRNDFTILETTQEPAAAWRERWQSLKLFTPARYSSLPGRAFPGDPDHYPTRDEVVATGPYQRPLVPAIADRLDPAIVQLHSSAYRSPQDVTRRTWPRRSAGSAPRRPQTPRRSPNRRGRQRSDPPAG